MASLRHLKNSVIFAAIFLAVLPAVALAGEERLLVEFDKSSICCILSPDEISENLEAVDGINIAIFNHSNKVITVYFETAKIDVDGIVAKVSEITDVEEEWILTDAD
ncbi:MAG: hypothetical protein V3S46_08395 [Nitrospinota bacterium]